MERPRRGGRGGRRVVRAALTMRASPPRLRARALTAAAILGGAWASLALVDAAVQKVQRDAETAAPAALIAAAEEPPLPRGRLFVLLVDSLRGPRAEVMPGVRALAARGLLVHVRATRDAATVPSLRAAFTGRTQRSIFAFVSNFIHGGGSVSSLFSQATARGDRVAVFSDGSFYELAGGVSDVHDNEQPPGDEETRQLNAFHEALALYRQGRHAVVVFHLTTIDHAAHGSGPRTPAYEHAFAVADQLLGEADAAVPATDTLVLLGDHGHDDMGRHFPGLEVPTVGLYRGPGFRPGTTVGPLPLTIHHYLMSWALGLPLTPDYRGAAVPEVLRGATPSVAYLSPPPEISAAPLRSRRFVWLAPLALVVAGAGVFGPLRVPRAMRKRRRATLATVGLAAVFVAWGAFLAHRRLMAPPPSTAEIRTSWAIALVLLGGAAAAGRVRRMTATWLVLCAPALFLYPGPTWDGWAAIMAPAWLTALALLTLDWARRRLGSFPVLTAREGVAFAMLAALAVLLLPFSYAQADGLASGDWSGYLSSNRMLYWVAVTAAAKGVIFARPDRGPVVNAAAAGAVVLFCLVSFGGFLPTQTSRLAATAIMGGAALLTRGARRDDRFGDVRALASLLANAALLMAYYATVVLDARNFLQLELLLAALRLSALAGIALGRPEDQRPFAAWLELMALIVAAWTTLALTLHRLEWSVLYHFFPAPLVERHVGLFLPAIVGRYALPLVLARRLLAETWPADNGSTWNAAAFGMGAKVATLTLVIIGSAILDPTSDPFMGAVAGLLTFSVLAVALVYEPAVPSRAT
jgi:hypothetical protein